MVNRGIALLNKLDLKLKYFFTFLFTITYGGVWTLDFEFNINR